MKKFLSIGVTAAMALSMCACAAQAPAATEAAPAGDDTPASQAAEDETEAPAADDGDLIKVGIINNDPNESGYRTANDKDMKATFTEENG